MFSLDQKPGEILSQVFLPMQSFENKKLNLYLGFWGVGFFFFFYKNRDLYICMVYSRAVYTANFFDA